MIVCDYMYVNSLHKTDTIEAFPSFPFFFQDNFSIIPAPGNGLEDVNIKHTFICELWDKVRIRMVNERPYKWKNTDILAPNHVLASSCIPPTYNDDSRETVDKTEAELKAERELVIVKRQKKLIIDDLDEVLPYHPPISLDI